MHNLSVFVVEIIFAMTITEYQRDKFISIKCYNNNNLQEMRHCTHIFDTMEMKRWPELPKYDQK